MNHNIFKKFITCGSGWTLEMERDYKDGEKPIYHLKMFGFWYPDGYELVGKNINKLMKQAIKDLRENQKKARKINEQNNIQ